MKNAANIQAQANNETQTMVWTALDENGAAALAAAFGIFDGTFETSTNVTRVSRVKARLQAWGGQVSVQF